MDKPQIMGKLNYSEINDQWTWDTWWNVNTITAQHVKLQNYAP